MTDRVQGTAGTAMDEMPAIMGVRHKYMASTFRDARELRKARDAEIQGPIIPCTMYENPTYHMEYGMLDFHEDVISAIFAQIPLLRLLAMRQVSRGFCGVVDDWLSTEKTELLTDELPVLPCRDVQLSLTWMAQHCSLLRSLTLLGSFATNVQRDTMKCIAESCPLLEQLILSGCVDPKSQGLLHVLKKCAQLRQLTVTMNPAWPLSLDSLCDCFRMWQALYKKSHSKSRSKVTTTTALLEELTLGNFKEAQEFQLTTGNGNRMLGIIARKCPNLTKLCLEQVRDVNDDDLQLLARHCPKLRVLDIDLFAEETADSENATSDDEELPEYPITDRGLIQIAFRCKELEVLRIRSPDALTSAVTGTGVSSILQNCVHLTELRLHGVNCPEVAALPDMSWLSPAITAHPRPIRHLELVNVLGLCDTDLATIGRSLGRTLEHVRFSFESHAANRLPQTHGRMGGEYVDVTLAGAVSLAKRCTSLRKLELCNVSSSRRKAEVDNKAALTELGELHGSTLEMFGLHECKHLSLSDLEDFFSECSNLRHLDLTLSRCREGGRAQGDPEGGSPNADTMLRMLGDKCPLLSTLCLSTPFAAPDQRDVSASSLRELARGCPRLLQLELEGVAVSGQGLSELARYCSQLESLKLVPTLSVVFDKQTSGLESELITDATLLNLVQHCPNLRKLVVTGNVPSVTLASRTLLTGRYRPLLEFCYTDVEKPEDEVHQTTKSIYPDDYFVNIYNPGDDTQPTIDGASDISETLQTAMYSQYSEDDLVGSTCEPKSRGCMMGSQCAYPGSCCVTS